MTADRVVELRRVRASELQANPKNWRTHPKAQRAAMTRTLDDLGYADALIARETPDGLELIDGHLRAETTPDEEVPVLVVDLDEAEADRLLASLDPLASMAVPDEGKLAELLAGVTLDNPELEALLGIGRNGQHPEQDDVLPPPAKPKTKVGDLYELGEHRLVCGDARDGAVLTALLGSVEADLVWTDPPYGVEYVGKTKEALRIRNDDEAGLRGLLTDVFSLALERCRPGACWYVTAPPGPSLDVFAEVLRDLGLRRHTLVWVKDVFVLGHSDYHYRHETLFYGWKDGPRHEPPNRRQDSVWEIPRPKTSTEHPTMKPVELVARAITNSTDPGEAILDPFAGAGTTAIAAEQLGRTAYLVEIDPAYCDVIVKRWETLTGKKAVRHRR